MDLPTEWDAVLRAVLAGKLAWSTEPQLAARTGMDGETLENTLDDMQANGLLDAFGECWTLSSLSQECLRVHIVDSKHGGRERWASIDDAAPKSRRSSDMSRLIDDVTDDRATRHWRPRSREANDLRRPTKLIQGCESKWGEGFHFDEDGKPLACTACKGSLLDAETYCLRCDRWGLDGVRSAILRREAKEEAEAKKRKKAG
jgi:hypothetical protein